MKTTRVPRTACPTCGYESDCASSLYEPEATPKPGDLAVCLKCGEILIYNGELRAIELTLDQMMNIPAPVSAQLSRLQAEIRRRRPLS